MSNQPRSIFGPIASHRRGSHLAFNQIGQYPSSNLWALTHIWPYVLIAAGIGLILRAYWK